MKEYHFEYMNQKYSSKLIIILFVSFLTLFLSTIFIAAKYFTKNQFAVIICFIISAGIPYLIYRKNKWKFKREATAKINDTSVEFKLHDDEVREIKYSDIKSYLVQHYNGTLLNLVLNNGEKFNLAVNPSFCETNRFYEFCQDIENTLDKYRTENNLDIVRKKSFFEKAWILPFLIILTAAIAIIILYGLLKGKEIPFFRLLAVIGPLIGLWGGYLGARKR